MQAGTRFTYPGEMEGCVDLGGWLYTEMVYLSADSHPSKYLIATRSGVESTTSQVLTVSLPSHLCHRYQCFDAVLDCVRQQCDLPYIGTLIEKRCLNFVNKLLDVPHLCRLFVC